MLKESILKSIRFYQKFISPNFGKICRFYPSCSEYNYRVIKKHGIIIGLLLGIKRIFKCNPWNRGGTDLP